MTNVAIENGPVEIVDFPIKNSDFPVRYVKLPEGISPSLICLSIVSTGERWRKASSFLLVDGEPTKLG